MTLPTKSFLVAGFSTCALLLCLAGDEMHVSVAAANRLGDALRGIPLHTSRSDPLDLEVGGELAGVEKGGTRYLSRQDLLALPQMKFTVSDDSNFAAPVEVRGVALEQLAKHLGKSPQSDLVVAICDDLYRANYPRAYVTAHHPVLVLEIDGQPPDGWPKDHETHGFSMGPYMITHPHFIPGFKILSHVDEPQVPWGVVRLEFREEERVFAVIAPRGADAAAQDVQAGYKIAQQNCFRCHNMGGDGGQEAGHPWLVLSAWATTDSDYFRAYVHNPQSKNPSAQMPAFPQYDQATLNALQAYFRTFTTLPVAALQHAANARGASGEAHAAPERR